MSASMWLEERPDSGGCNSSNGTNEPPLHKLDCLPVGDLNYTSGFSCPSWDRIGEASNDASQSRTPDFQGQFTQPILEEDTNVWRD